MQIDPWSSAQYADYAKLRDEFGIEEFDPEGLPEPDKLMRRGVIFGCRGYEYIRRAILEGTPFIILSGLMPSGKMHIGNKMVIDQMMYYQKLGAHIYVCVADIESYGTRGIPFDEAEKIAIEEYVLNYIALGLALENTQIYFQSKRIAVKDIAFTLGRKIPWSQYSAIYGFKETTNMCHMLAPLIQVGDILFPMLQQYSGPLPLLVPVGVDQDPHMRLTRDIAAACRLLNVTLTKDYKIGIFVKGEENVQSLLDQAKTEMEKLGFADFKMMQSYKALYLPGATEEDIPKINEALILMEAEVNKYAFYPPAATFHRFQTGLTGGKMSSSEPASAIYLTDTPEEGMKKVSSSITGGGVSIEEHKKHGGKPEKCSVYELFVYHLLDDDEELRSIYENCKGGRRLCGECKKQAAEGIGQFLKGLALKREEAKGVIDQYLKYD
jgi:tryptophanyl-tRNA synthetase